MRTLFSLSLLGVLGLLTGLSRPEICLAQRVTLSGMSLETQIDAASNTTLSHLERAREFLQAKQWDEAIETIRRVLEGESDELIRLAPGDGDRFAAYVPARVYCHYMLAELKRTAPEALELYRSHTDPLARRWRQEALDKRDPRLLQRLVDQLFATSYGDEALLRLGELALERGRFNRARFYWEQLSPTLRTPLDYADVFLSPPGSAQWLGLRGFDFEKNGERLRERLLRSGAPLSRYLAYPDTNLDLADVRARLVLVSILEGSRHRAEVEWRTFRLLHPEAEGSLGGRKGKFSDLLERLLKQSESWPQPASQDWPTFAGAQRRWKVAKTNVDPAGTPLWSAPLEKIAAEDEAFAGKRRRTSESRDGLVGYHPVVIGDRVFIGQPTELRAYDLHTGEAAFRQQEAADEKGDASVILRHEPPNFRTIPETTYYGVPRFTMSSADNRLFARLGSPITAVTRFRELPREALGVIAGVDLSSQGKLLPGFPLRVGRPEWSFDGPPVSNGSKLFVAMRRRDAARVQLHVACFDIRDGERLWRRQIVSTQIPGAGQWQGISHTLLTMHEGDIYCNTNMGAVVAIRMSDGKVRWLATYPRAGLRPSHPDRSDRHYLRDLNPCLAYKDLIICGPSDCNRLFALDAGSGRRIWESTEEPGVDAMHLLGVGKNNLIVSGDYLYWIDVWSGATVGQFPAARRQGDAFAAPNPCGYGRGLLFEDKVCWPTREALYIFNQATRPSEVGWEPVMARPPVDLTQRGATGGNLVLSGDMLLIASSNRLYAFDQGARERKVEDVPKAAIEP